MKVPLSWLKELVDFDGTAEELGEKLTFSGVEVESIKKIGIDFTGVVVGQVLTADKHPSADRLKLCKVTDGSKEYQVVCGAPNVEAGQKVILARLGVKLANGMVLKEAKIRGQSSFGMICAEDEIGLSDDHTGIIVLPADTKVGISAGEIYGPADTVLDLEITWNRPDCLSILGIAREVAALYGKKVKVPSVEIKESSEAVDKKAAVVIEDARLCPRYTARVINGLKQAPSPEWMQKRLKMCGVRPINNLVDVTNYVMLECGHPLHAFDYRFIRGSKIVVRRAKPGEKMVTLDNIERKLDGDMLVIADTERAVALAGVMGGVGSEIVDSTADVLLESASFDPPNIRATSSKTGLGTESSYRFERGVDVNGVEWASRRAAKLLAELGGGSIAKGVIDIYPAPLKEKKILFRFDRCRDLLGIEIADQKIMSIFTALQLNVQNQNERSCEVVVPTLRRDLEIEADLIEEVARMNGLENVPSNVPLSKVVIGADDSVTRARMKLSDNLVSLGLTEAMHYSFLSQKLLDLFGTYTESGRVVLPNPVSSDYAVMRNSLIPQMVDSLGRNLAHQVSTAMLFEIGKVYLKNEGRISEEERLCIGMMGKAGRALLDKRRAAEQGEMFVWLKGIVQDVAVLQRAGAVEFKQYTSDIYEPGYAASIVIDGAEAGVFGILSEKVRCEWRMLEPVAIAEISAGALIKDGRRQAVELKPLPAYPSVSRDIAMIVPESLRHEEIISVIRKNAPRELTQIELFDIFKGKGIAVGNKSVAYSLTYRSLERTLTDDDANKYHEAIKDVLKKELKVEIREG